MTREEEQECERVAGYSVDVCQWYNIWNSRYREKEAVQKEFADIYKNNLSYISSFFNKHHFDTINILTGLHKMAGVYSYAGKKRSIRVSSQDGRNGSTYISSCGPALYFGDIPKFVEKMWDSVMDYEILNKAERMWKERRGRDTTAIEAEYDVVIPLNLFFDGPMLGVQTIFGDLLTWLEETLDYVIHNLKCSIMIREHPMGKLLPKYMKRCELYTLYPELIERYRGNPLFRYVKSEEELNVYQYIEHCKVVIPWTSTTGVESGVMKKTF